MKRMISILSLFLITGCTNIENVRDVAELSCKYGMYTSKLKYKAKISTEEVKKECYKVRKMIEEK